MKKIVISCVCFLIANTAFSQIQYDFNKFTPLASIGTLPNEVTMKGGDFMLSSKKNIDKKGNKRTKKKFVLHSSYAVKDIFNNGRVLYNDPISEYVEKVRKEITKSDPQLASETKIYVIKSSVVNAFATNQGYIFITTGLLSQLENEAQLAFILCHELMHYKMKHAVIEYVQNDQIDKNKGPFRKSEIDSKYLTKAHYSREYETEADLTGFDLYAKTSYSMDVLDGLFDVLKYSKSPFEEIEFKSKDLLETNYLVFPKDFIRDKVDEITGIDEDTDDSESTHPNLKKRRTDIADKIAGLGSEDNSRTRSAYVVSENTFLTARAMARFDLCHTSLINCTYDLAIYQAYCLLKEYPNNTYLEATILKGLYGLTKYNIGNRLEEVCYSPNTVQGEMQRLTALLKRLTKDEMNVIALNYAWRLKTKYKNNNNEVNLITADLFECLVSQYPDKSVFSLTPMDVVKTDIVSAPDTVAKPKESVENAELSSLKNNGPNYVERILKIGDKDYFLTYAFVDLLKDQTFVKTYDSLTQKINNKKMDLIW
ncbi:MAG: M48 family metallopeptidase [Sphingobacteriales bacterium JAD_PAG50586_3]|nr:MAG: M48 family metallopeptidase [Sphingobacteriales bacterium JAD_PAG50586_3]